MLGRDKSKACGDIPRLPLSNVARDLGAGCALRLHPTNAAPVPLHTLPGDPLHASVRHAWPLCFFYSVVASSGVGFCGMTCGSTRRQARCHMLCGLSESGRCIFQQQFFCTQH